MPRHVLVFVVRTFRCAGLAGLKARTTKENYSFVIAITAYSCLSLRGDPWEPWQSIFCTVNDRGKWGEITTPREARLVMTKEIRTRFPKRAARIARGAIPTVWFAMTKKRA